MKIGNITLEPDTIQVLVITTLATGVILAVTGFGLLANNWRSQVEGSTDNAAAAHHALPAAEPAAPAAH